MNFGDLSPYLTYDFSPEHSEYWSISGFRRLSLVSEHRGNWQTGSGIGIVFHSGDRMPNSSSFKKNLQR